MNPYNEVLFEEVSGKEGSLGLITLNRPAALNSLNHDMIAALFSQLQLWAKASHIKAVIIRAAEGRAFCAGGDIRLTYERVLAKDPAMYDFFREEYQLNRFIFHYPKPYIALLSGITMGGGAGISIHGSHRVASERLVFAMPETGIGFYPDVGGTYFLPRLPGAIGVYLGLTGARINSDDCVALGIVQQKVAEETMPLLIEALLEKSFANDPPAAVTAVLKEFKIAANSSPLIEQQAAIDACFSQPSMEEILSALNHSHDDICLQAKALLTKKSPTSLKVTLKALQSGKRLNFDACMEEEARLTSHFLQRHDFIEGIRALIIDKDQQPSWKPASIAEVSNEIVADYFAPLEQITN